jgi:hypothetical protein
MSLSTLVFSVMVFAAPPEPAPAPTPAPAVAPTPAPAPAPGQDPYAQQPAYQDPYAPQPQPQPGYQDPYAQPYQAPAPAPYVPPEQTGIGMLVTGPILVAVGVPFSFLGNGAWREGCGPLDTNSACAGGTAASVAGHTFAGLAFGTGILLTGLGGSRKGKYDGKRDPTRASTGFIAGGAVMLPLSLAGMLAVRSVLLTTAIDCETEPCVAQFQTISTITVSTLALTASAGAGLLLYGVAYNKHRQPSAMVLPQVGRGFAGLSLAGRF